MGQILQEVEAFVEDEQPGLMDKGARESLLTFESGVGDAIVTYENEVLVSRKAGSQIDYVVPRSTILIENPAAVVDAYAAKHGTRALADRFRFAEPRLPLGDGRSAADGRWSRNQRAVAG